MAPISSSCPSPAALESVANLPREELVATLRRCALFAEQMMMAHPLRRLEDTAEAAAAECGEDELHPPDPEFYLCVATVVFLICMAGLMAGCTMGLLSLDPLTLKLKASEGSPQDQASANAVLGLLQASAPPPSKARADAGEGEAPKPRSRRHHMLVALLLCNAAANEALPIFLDRLVSPTMAVLLSVTCVLIFGEILPSAVMTGPAQLQIAASLAPIVSFLMMLTAPLSVPIAYVLDVVIGDHDGVTRFKRNEFKALVKMQARAKRWMGRSIAYKGDGSGAPGVGGDGTGAAPPPSLLVRTRTPAELRKSLSGVLEGTRKEQKERASARVSFAEEPGANPTAAAGSGGGSADDKEEEAATEFSDDEVTILHAVFSLQAKHVHNLLEEGRNTFEHVRMLPSAETMDMATMRLITQWGVSRIPIYDGERANVRGLLLVKEHISLDPSDQVPIAQLKIRPPALISPDASVFDALNLFQTGRSHMALVTPHAAEIEASWAAGVPVPPHVRILGVCTIEDVIEELIGEEVLDETDRPMTPGEMLAAGVPAGGGHRFTITGAQTERARAAKFSVYDPLLSRDKPS